jgi:DNA-directed RNA polymerase specialized sigma24 family protein
MNPIDPDSSLEILIRHCINKDSQFYENAWQEFLNRYKIQIYQFILYKCKSWNSSKINSQLKDIVNDIVSEVFEIIPNSLVTFKSTNDEKSFLYWLSTICSRTVSRYFKKNVIIDIIENDVIEKYDLRGDLSVDNRWELYEYIINIFTKRISTRRNASRDLLIFLLYTWGNFSEDEIKEYFCFNDIGHKVVDNVISRSRKILYQLKD